jgi:hypothetical protein
MRSLVWHSSWVLFSILVGVPVFAQDAADDSNEGEPLELSGFKDTFTGGSTEIEVDGVGAIGNPFKRLVRKWPEDLVVAPVPGYSPQMGWNLKLVGAYFLDSDDDDPEARSSAIGAFAMGAENGSYAYGGGTKLHLLDDKLRLQVGAGYMDVRYRFYGIGNAANDRGIGLDILQRGPVYFAKGSWRIWKQLYAGLGYVRGSVETRARFVIPDTNSFDPSLDVDIGALIIPLNIDSRDNEQFPRDGWLINSTVSLYRESLASDFDATIVNLNVNRYVPMRQQDTFAWRAVVRSASGDSPFFLLSTFGGSKDLRGYPSGRYRDSNMYAVQGEYRWQFNDSWILTGFAGFGEVFAESSEIGNNFLPAAGAGVRYVLSKKHKVSLSADIAVGNDGAEFYFGVGEAF